MEANLIELAKVCPEAIISVKVGDLIEANEALVAKTKEQLEQLITDSATEIYPSRQKVAEILDVDLSTPASLGQTWSARAYRNWRKRRYRMSDVRRMLNNGKL